MFSCGELGHSEFTIFHNDGSFRLYEWFHWTLDIFGEKHAPMFTCTEHPAGITAAVTNPRAPFRAVKKVPIFCSAA